MEAPSEIPLRHRLCTVLPSRRLRRLPSTVARPVIADTAGQCGAISAGEVLTIETILAKYGVVITGDADDEVIVFLFDDPEDIPVGSIQPRKEDAVLTDDKSNAEPTNEPDTIASKAVTVQPPLEIGGEAADDVATTGPTARRIPAAAEPVDDRTIE
jgi:hypothetical protein